MFMKKQSLLNKQSSQCTNHMELIEPRLLLNADALSLAGLPGIDNQEDDTFEKLSSDLGTLQFGSDLSPIEPSLKSPHPILINPDLLQDSSLSDDPETTFFTDFSTDHYEGITELVFIDTNTPDYERLLDQLTQEQNTNMMVYLINSEQDGIKQITHVLSQHQNIAAIHLISHGSAGEISLGNTHLNNGTVEGYSNDIMNWRNAFHDEADILIYGCDVASNPAGIALTQSLSHLTGADIAASTDLTGNPNQHADWELEHHVGYISTEVLFDNDNIEDWEGTLGPIKLDSNFIVNTETLDKQDDAAVAVHSDGSFVVTWASHGGDASESGIKMQRFDVSGNPIGNEILVNVNENNAQLTPSIAMNSSGDFVIAWTTQENGHSDISARVFNANGQPKEFNALSDIEVDTSLGDQYRPDVAIDEAGRFVIVYSGERSDLGDGSGVFAQRFDQSGNAVGDTVRVNNTFTGDTQDNAKVAMDFDGDFVVVFEDDSGSDGTRISATLFDWRTDDSLVTSGNFVVSESANRSERPDVAMDHFGNFTITWTSEKQSGDSSDTEIFYRQYSFNGNSLSDDPILIQASDQIAPRLNSAITMDNDGNFVISWTQINHDGAGKDIYAQAFMADGTQSGNEQVVSNALNDQDYSNVFLNNTGQFTVVWSGMGETDDEGIFAQRYKWDEAAGKIPTLTDFSNTVETTTEDVQVEITIAELLGTGNEVDEDGFVNAFIVKSVTSGTLKIGINASMATAFKPGTNDVINGYLKAYWTPENNAINKQEAFKVVARDNDMLTSAQPIAVNVHVNNINDPATGTVSIDGLAQEDQILSANVSDLSDADGIATYQYQWLRDGVAIDGATQSQYLLSDDDVGTNISLSVSFTDYGNTIEGSFISTQTAVIANINDAPTGSVIINNITPDVGAKLQAFEAILDADGISGQITFQWQRDGVDIDGATKDTYSTDIDDFGATISVIATYVDDHGTSESIFSASTNPVTNSNTSPTGLVTIDNLTPSQGDTVTATNNLDDPDGLSGVISYQWQRNGVDIEGATDSSYTLTQADVGMNINVLASYTDDLEHYETISSAQTQLVENINDAAMGTPVIIGSAIEDQTLIADVSQIGDIDGLGELEYRWYRDGSAINGATDKTYTLSDEDVGKNITLKISYTDLQGTFEGPLISESTAKVVNINDTPIGAPTVTGIPQEHQFLTANLSGLSDDDGIGEVSYQWLRDGNIIEGATDKTYFLDDIDTGKHISVKVYFTDLHGTQEGPFISTPTIAIGNVNDVPTLSLSNITIFKGGTTHITPDHLSSEDIDNDDLTLTFKIDNLSGGRFINIDNPDEGISQFTQAELQAGKIAFVDDGDFNKPTFEIKVSDGNLSSFKQIADVHFDPMSIYLGGTQEQQRTTVTTEQTDSDSDSTRETTKSAIEPEPELANEPEAKSEIEVEHEQDVKDKSKEPTAENEDNTENENILSGVSGDIAADQSIDVFVNAAISSETQSNQTQLFSQSSIENVPNATVSSFSIQTPFGTGILSASEFISQISELESFTNELSALFSGKGITKDFDRIREDFVDSDTLQKHQIASSIAVSTGFSVGYVLWLIRSGALLSTVISSLPAWQFIDPLPVLSTLGAKAASGFNSADTKEDESLESMFEKSSSPEQSKTQTKKNNSFNPGSAE